MCGACYQGFADVAGTSAPFLAVSGAAAWQKVRRGLGLADSGDESPSESPLEGSPAPGDDVLTG